MGNGASELIDLVVRKALLAAAENGQQQPTWKGSPWNVQVKCPSFLIVSRINFYSLYSTENINVVLRRMASRFWNLLTPKKPIWSVLSILVTLPVIISL